MKIEIARDYGADWAGLYVDGKLTTCGHLDDIDHQALRLLNVEEWTFRGDYSRDCRGGFPSNIQDVYAQEVENDA